MELLAPAGSPAHLTAALDAGADAVYLGGKLFSARKFAGNFSDEEMKEAVRLAHVKGACVYVTLNTLISDKEMKDLAGYLRFLGSIPIDGLLVQDYGVVAMAREIAPHIPLHASTQMTVSNLSGVKFLGDRGFQRVVLSRELSLREIKAITDATDVEIEVFVHGALCVSYSGQCLMSSFIGGRSGNRGSCAQPCRMPYELVDAAGKPMNPKKGKYILSLKDMMGLSRIPELLDARVASLKVEGRMKSPEYVFNTVSAYRKAIDAAEKARKIDTEPLRLHLEEEFNRGYTTAYPDDTAGPAMMTEYAPGNHGVHAGLVESIKTGQFIFRAEEMRALSEITGVSYETAEKTIAYVPGNQVFPMKQGRFRVTCDARPKKEGQVYWNVEPKKKSLALKDLVGKIPLSFYLTAKVGEALSLSARDDKGHHVTAMSDFLLERAESRVTSEEEIKKQLGRLGNTWFTLQDAKVFNADCMVPKSILNHLRTEVIEKLETIRAKEHEEAIPKGISDKLTPAFTPKTLDAAPSVWVRTDRIEHVEEALEAGVKHFIFGGESLTHLPISKETYEKAVTLAHEKGAKIFFAAPRVMREKFEKLARRRFLDSLTAQPDGVFLEYAGAAEWLGGVDLPIIAGPSLNVFNQKAEATMEQLGFSGAFVSQELTIPQIRDIAAKSCIPLGAYIYGRTEMMISEYCAINAVMGEAEKKACPQYCLQHAYFLSDGEGRKFPVKTDEWCHMHIQNSHVLDMRPYMNELKKAGLSYLCLDLRGASGAVKALCRDFCDIQSGKKAPPKPAEGQGVTRGHFFRGVL